MVATAPPYILVPGQEVKARGVFLLDVNGDPISSFGGDGSITGPLGSRTDSEAVASALSTQDRALIQALIDKVNDLLVETDEQDLGVAATATLTSVNSSAGSVTIHAADSDRIGLLIFNTDANALLIKYGATASASSFTVKIAAGGYWEMPFPIYTGIIDGIWEADGAGVALVTELT